MSPDKRLFVFLLLASILLPAARAANPENGKALHDARCRSCHTSIMNGEPDRIYTRENRRIHSLAGLRDQVSRCEANTGIRLDAQQTEDVIDYLNRQFYKFGR